MQVLSINGFAELSVALGFGFCSCAVPQPICLGVVSFSRFRFFSFICNCALISWFERINCVCYRFWYFSSSFPPTLLVAVVVVVVAVVVVVVVVVCCCCSCCCYSCCCKYAVVH